MPGYFTDSRTRKLSFPDNTVTYHDQGEFVQNLGPAYDPINQTQTTTSFRSRSQTDDQTIAGADKIYINGFKELSSKFDTGHEFFSKQEFASVGLLGQASGSIFGQRITLKGAFIPIGLDEGGFKYPTIDKLSDSEIAYYGHKAIASTEPVQPGAQLGDFLTQSVLTKLPKFVGDIGNILTKTELAREAGAQYLNLEFGWAPMVSDLKALLNTVLNSYKLIKQYESGSGKTTRRSWRFPTTSDYSESAISPGAGVANLYATSFPGLWKGNNPYGNYQTTSIRSTRMWFRGAYVYFLDFGPELRSRFEKYASLSQQLLGLKLTPQVLWDLAPWSWLADWKFDLTSILSINQDLSTDNLVIKYGYLMRETRASNNYIVSGVEPINGPKGPYTASLTVVQKERVKATPYGFGVNPEGFTLQQLAILAALGLTQFLKP
jgi:hypothetical protein